MSDTPLSTQQNFSASYCRVKFYDITTSGNKMYSAQHVEKWSQEIQKYIASAEVVLKDTQDGGNGDFTVTLTPDLSTMMAWLNNTDNRGDWLRVGGFVSLQFGYQDSDDKTLEFMGSMNWPEIDFNPTSPSLTIKGVVANSLLWEGIEPFQCYNKIPKDIINEKARQYNYDVTVGPGLAENLNQYFPIDKLMGSEGVETFVRDILPWMVKPRMLTDGKHQLFSAINGKNWTLDLIPVPSKKDTKPIKFIFRFMGQYDLQSSPQVVAVNSIRIPFQWNTFVPSAMTPNVESHIGDDKSNDEQMVSKDDKGSQVTRIAGDSRYSYAVDAHQDKLEEIKKRYLSYNADVDTIGLPTLEIGDYVKFHNTGLVDNALWQVFRATHKWSSTGYNSSWILMCINFDDAFGLNLKNGIQGPNIG